MNAEFTRIAEAIESGEMKPTQEIGHVTYYLIDKTAYSFHFYAEYENDKGNTVYTEFFYDLRNKEYFIKRNGKPVRFNIANLDMVIPRYKDGYRTAFYCKAGAKQFFDMVSVPENAGMYEAMLDAVGSLGEEKVDMTSRALIRLITDYNKLELLYKAGIDIDAMGSYYFRDLVYAAGKNDARKIHEIFGVSKSQFKFLRENLANTYDLAKAVTEYHAKFLTKDDIDFYHSFRKHLKELDEKYADNRADILIANSTIFHFLDTVWRTNAKYGALDDNHFYGFVAYYKISNPYKLAEYLLHECYNSQGLQYSTAFSEYKDYYMMCTDLEYTNFTKYPRFLRTYHDIVTRNYKSISDELTNKKFAQVVEQYRHLETVVDDFAIVVPTEAKELVTEGNSLHHCVGGYVKKVANNRSLIVFLRDKEKREDSLVTVEIRGDQIVQALGDVNRYPTEEEQAALRKFAKRKSLKYKSIV